MQPNQMTEVLLEILRKIDEILENEYGIEISPDEPVNEVEEDENEEDPPTFKVDSDSTNS